MTTKKINAAYVNANKLEMGSKFNYLGSEYTVIGLTSSSIISEGVDGKAQKISPYDFEGYVYYGFLKIA